MKKLIILILLLTLPSICTANPISDFQTRVGADKFAHFGMTYFLADELKQHTHLTPLERVLVCTFVAYAKEKWVDSVFDKRDMTAGVAGVLVYEFRFKWRF